MSLRRLAAIVMTILVGVVATFLVLVIAFSVAPVLSGALLLLLPTGAKSVVHDLSPSYEPVHQGHVDVSTGLYIRDDEDLVLAETPPFVWRRTYLSGDHVSRQFGVGATHNAEWYLIGDSTQFQWVELILEDGGRIRFDRLTPGSSFLNAVFGHNRNPTQFYGAMVGWVGSSWAMRLRNGSLLMFRSCEPGDRSRCSIVQSRDSDGHKVSFDRNSNGLLRRLDTGRQHLTLQYDEQQRIATASDDRQHVVRYAYDVTGHLVRSASEKIIRTYEYAGDNLVAVNEPGRRVENTYDGTGRLSHQTVRRPDTPDYVESFAYTVFGGEVAETDVTETGGVRTRYRFDNRRYVVSESYDAPGESPVTVSYDRGSGEFVRTLTVRCTKDGRRVSGTRAMRSSDVERAKEQLIQETCR